MSKRKAVTLIVRGSGFNGKGHRALTLAEEVSTRKAAKGKIVDTVVWPVATPVYSKGAEATKLRKHYHAEARAEARRVLEYVADVLANDSKLVVIVESGAVLNSDPQAGRWGNVPAPWLLAEIANQPGVKVRVQAGAEDPREYEPTVREDRAAEQANDF